MNFSDCVLAKDFIETAEGLVFAVVESGLEQGKVLCFLRYFLSNTQWQKIDTTQANALLAEKYPPYLYYSPFKQAHCHAIDIDRVLVHHCPRTRLKKILANKAKDKVELDLQTLCHLFKKQEFNLDDMGVTGSILISAHNESSDIDLVFYSRDDFLQARKITQKLIAQGDCFGLSENDWKQSYDRRSCDLSYAEYVWHERRKLNKAMINQRKFDLSCVSETKQSSNKPPLQYKKLKSIVLKVQVINDSLAFDYPAVFLIKHPQINAIVSFTATYTGQAFAGEWVEVAGLLEQASDGTQRIVVGSSREASGEYIKVINE